jgi:glycerol kinase
MANAVADNGGVYLIPAFSGVGFTTLANGKKSSLSGINFGTTKNHIVRAALSLSLTRSRM